MNDITSQFTFRDGLIQTHKDRCDALAWARQAFPFPASLLIGLIGPLRRRKAAQKLAAFVGEQDA